MKTYIIDGYNLLWKSTPDLMKTAMLEEARLGIEKDLQEFLALGGAAEILLVYDGQGRGTRPGPGRAGLKTCFSPTGKTADDTILDLAQDYPGKGETTIVSSDLKDINRRLRGLRVRSMTSEEFLAVLEKKLRAVRGRGRQAESPDGKPSAPKGEDIDRWLEDFDMKEG